MRNSFATFTEAVKFLRIGWTKKIIERNAPDCQLFDRFASGQFANPIHKLIQITS